MLRKTLYQLPRSLPFLWAVLLSALLFTPTWYALFRQWLQFEQILAHGLVTFLLFLGLILLHPPRGPEPDRFSRKTPGWPILGGLALVMLTLVWVIFELVNIDLLGYLMLPTGIAATTWVLFGFRAMWRFVPHLLIFALSLPFWGDLVTPLVNLASWAVGGFVGMLGMTALIEGSSITLPYGRLLIADGCSGIRYFAISILLGGTIALLNDYRWKGWLILIAVAMALGIVTNWIRITGLVIVGYQSEMQSSLMEDHELYGWLIYALVCLPALYFAPVKRRKSEAEAATVMANPRGYLAILVAVLLGPALLWANTGSIEQKPAWALAGQEPVKTGLVRRPPLAVTLPESLQQTHYVLEQQQVWVTLAQFQRSHSREKLVPYIAHQWDASRWAERHDLSENTAQGPIRVLRNVLNQRQVARLQWYRVGTFNTTDYRIAKLLQIPATVLRDNRFALVTAQTACQSSGCEQAIDLLSQAAESLQLE